MMDPARRSALVGVVLGLAVAAMGTFIVAIAARFVAVPDSDIHVPRFMLGLIGIGIGVCGLAFMFTMLGPRVTATIAAPGVALAYVLPIAWIVLGRPGKLECSANVSLWFFRLGGIEVGDTTCRALLVFAGIAAVAVVIGLAWLAARRGYRRSRDSDASGA